MVRLVLKNTVGIPGNESKPAFSCSYCIKPAFDLCVDNVANKHAKISFLQNIAIIVWGQVKGYPSLKIFTHSQALSTASAQSSSNS